MSHNPSQTTGILKWSRRNAPDPMQLRTGSVIIKHNGSTSHVGLSRDEFWVRNPATGILWVLYCKIGIVKTLLFGVLRVKCELFGAMVRRHDNGIKAHLASSVQDTAYPQPCTVGGNVGALSMGRAGVKKRRRKKSKNKQIIHARDQHPNWQC